MQTIHITIRGDDLSDLEIRKLPPHKADIAEKHAVQALHEAVFRNEVKESEQFGRSDAREGNAI